MFSFHNNGLYARDEIYYMTVCFLVVRGQWLPLRRPEVGANVFDRGHMRRQTEHTTVC